MANLQTTTINGTFKIGDTASTAAAGYIWFNSEAGKLQYSYTSGPSILICTP